MAPWKMWTVKKNMRVSWKSEINGNQSHKINWTAIVAYMKNHQHQLNVGKYLAKSEYFTNLDFPEIAGVPFPFQNATLLGPREPCEVAS